MFGFGDLFILIVAGLFGPIAAGYRPLALPVVAGEILAGIIIGKTGFGWVNIQNETLIFLTNFGFALLLFQVGTRLPVTHVFKGISGSAQRGIWAAVWTFALAIPLGFALSHVTGIGHPVMFILLGAASSTSTVFPVMAERGTSGDESSALTVWIPTDDIGTMVLLPLAFGIGSTPLIMLGCLVVSLSGLGAFLGIKWFRETNYGQALRKLSKRCFWAFDMRIMTGALVGLAALSMKFGTSVLVAGLVVGVMSNLLQHPKRFNEQMNGLGEGFLVPLFFVYVGARIDLRDMFTSLANVELAALIVTAGLLIHMLAAKLAGLRFTTGMIASQHMGLPAALVSMGLAQQILNPGQAAAIMTASLFSLAVCLYGVKFLPIAAVVGKPKIPPAAPPPNPAEATPCVCGQPKAGDADGQAQSSDNGALTGNRK